TAGSVTFIPPTVAVYTSLLPNGTLIRRSSTASTMLTLAASSPLTARRGCASVESETSACTSHNSGRLPSTVTVMAVPGTGSLPPFTNSPEGSTTSTMPSSTSSKQPISSAAPKRFFTPRTNRRVECFSPSNCNTTSTRCSNSLGPATDPSLVTCPTRITGRSRSLARETNPAATARTCVTPPGDPSDCAVDMVCI